MAIKFKCDCGRLLQARDERAGTRGKCPACGASVAVPEVIVAEIVQTERHTAVRGKRGTEVAQGELEPVLGFNIPKACGTAIQQGTAAPISNETTSRSGGLVGPTRGAGASFVPDKGDSCGVQLAILFTGAFFIGDCLLDVILDGLSIGRGSLIKGFRLSGRTTPGRHELRVKWGKKTCLQGVVSFDQPGRYSIRLSLNRWLKQFAIADIFRDEGEKGFSPEENQPVPVNHGLPVETHFTSMAMPERTRTAARIKPNTIACVSIADVEQKYRWLFIPVLSWLGLVFPLVLPPIPLGPIAVSVAWNRREWMSHITRSLNILGKKRKTYGFPLGWCVNVFINLMDMATLGLSHLFVTASLHDELAKKASVNGPRGDFSAVAWVNKWLLMGNVVFVMVYMACPGLLFRRILLSMEGHLRTLESEAAKEEPIVAQVVQGSDAPSLSQIAPDATALGRVVPVVSGRQGIEGKTDPRQPGDAAGGVNLTITFPGKRGMYNRRLPMLLDGMEIGTLRLRSGCAVQVRTGLGAHCLQLKAWLDKHTLTLQLPRPGNYVALLAFGRWSGKFTVESLNWQARESVAESPVASAVQGNGTPRKTGRKKRWLIAAGVTFAVLVLLAWLGSTEPATWSAAQRANTPAAYQDYLRRFPNGEHASAAREGIKRVQQESDRLERETAALWDLFPEWAHWAKAAREDAIENYQKFLMKFPKGRYAEAAKRRMQQMEANKNKRFIRSSANSVMEGDSWAFGDKSGLQGLQRDLEADPPIRGKLRVLGSSPRSGAEWPDELQYEPDFIEATVLLVETRTVKIGEYNVSGKAGYREEAQVWMVRWPAKKVVAEKRFSADPVPSRTVDPLLPSVTSREEYGDVGPVLKEWISKRPRIKIFYICGDVKSPGQYELKEGSIFDALKMAGGTVSSTTAPRMRVYRTNMKLFGGSELKAWEYDPSEWDSRRRHYIETVEDADIIVVGNPEKAK